MFVSKKILGASRSFALLAFSAAASPALAQEGPVIPDNLDLRGNLLGNPGFDSADNCGAGWEIRRTTATDVLCRYPGAIWLNYNNQGEDRSAIQTVSGLVPGQTYVLRVSYRAGPTARTYVGNRTDFFAIRIDDRLIEDERVAISDEWRVATIEFRPTSSTARIQLIGEYGSDGDVLVNSASLVPAGAMQAAERLEADRRYYFEGGTYYYLLDGEGGLAIYRSEGERQIMAASSRYSGQGARMTVQTRAEGGDLDGAGNVRLTTRVSEAVADAGMASCNCSGSDGMRQGDASGSFSGSGSGTQGGSGSFSASGSGTQGGSGSFQGGGGSSGSFDTAMQGGSSASSASGQSGGSSVSVSGSGVPADPDGLGEGNFFSSAGFSGASCYGGWTLLPAKDSPEGANACSIGESTVWLKRGGGSRHSGLRQKVTGLTVGASYVFTVQWRTVSASSGSQEFATIQSGKEQIGALSGSSESSGWMTTQFVYVATSKNANITIRVNKQTGEGILLNWVSMRSSEAGDGSSGQAQENAESAQKAASLPARTRMLAYSINDQQRGSADASSDYFVTMTSNGRGHLEQGGGTPLEIVKLGGGQVAFRLMSGAGAGMYLVGYDNHAAFEADLTEAARFYARSPLEPSGANFASFESVAYPGQFLRHQGFALKLDAADAGSPSLLRRDATFRFVPFEEERKAGMPFLQIPRGADVRQHLALASNCQHYLKSPSGSKDVPQTITFINRGSEPRLVTLHSQGPDVVPLAVAALRPGESHAENTFEDQVFTTMAPDGRCTVGMVVRDHSYDFELE